MDAATGRPSLPRGVEAAWAAATAKPRWQKSTRALGEGAKVYRVVRNDLRAFAESICANGQGPSGAEIDVEDCDDDNDGVDMNTRRARHRGVGVSDDGFQAGGGVDADALVTWSS